MAVFYRTSWRKKNETSGPRIEHNIMRRRRRENNRNEDEEEGKTIEMRRRRKENNENVYKCAAF